MRLDTSRRPNPALLVLGAIAGAAVLGRGLVTVAAGQDAIFRLLALVDLALSFVFYPFGLLQFVFLSLLGEPFPEQGRVLQLFGLVIAFRRFIDLTLLGRPLRGLAAAPSVWTALFVLSLSLSLLGAQDLSEGWSGLQTYVQLLILFLLVVDFVRGERELKWLLLVFTLSALINTGLGFYEFYVEGVRISGTTGNPNGFGLTQLISLCLLLPVAGYAGSTAWASMLLMLCGTIAYTIVLSLSRASLVAAVAAGLYYLVFLRMRGRGRKVATVFALVAIVPTTWWLAPEGVFDRIGTIPTSSSDVASSTDTSIQKRTAFMWAGVEMGLDHMWTGVGLKQFPYHVVRYSDFQLSDQNVAHNMYVSVFAEAGIIALVMFLGALLSWLLAARSGSQAGGEFLRAMAGGSQLGLVAFLVAGAFGNLEYLKVAWVVAGLAVAIRETAVRESRKSVA